MRKCEYNPRIRMGILMFILVLSMIMLSSTLTVYAEDVTVDVQFSNGGTNSSNNKYVGGVNHKRTGMLCYLIGKDGTLVDGMVAKGFRSPGYPALGNETWAVKSKKGGYSITEWAGSSDIWWNKPPFGDAEGKVVPSYASDIEAWAKQKDDGVKENAIRFVQKVWGKEEWTKAFQQGEYVLVMETIMSFQPCEKSASEQVTARLMDKSTEITLASNSNTRTLALEAARKLIKEIRDADPKKGIIFDNESNFNAVVDGIERSLKSLKGQISKKAVGNPIIGTLSGCIRYQQSVGAYVGNFDRYTSNIACFAEEITANGAGVDAGFVYYEDSRDEDVRLSAGQIDAHGVGMLVIKAKDDATIKTYWEPNGSPGKPEPAKPNKTGTCAIVKGYYEENETTGVKTSLGVFSEKDTTNNIQICEEPGFELVRWDISTVYNNTLDPTDWTPPSSLRDGKNPETVKLETPEKVVYVLLKRTLEEEEEAPADVNYTLSQSTITRQIHISEPDNRLTMPKIEDHEFIWKLLGHVVECVGHECDGHEVTKSGSHDSDCPSDCTSSHSYTDTEYHDNVYCSNWVWFDDKLVFSLKNEQKSDFPDVLATKGGWENVTTLKGLALWVQPFTRTIPEETLKGYKNLDYACVLLRGKDKLTVAEWKNTDLNVAAANSDLREVSSAGFCIGNTLMGSRKTEDYKDNFTVSIVDNSLDNTTKYGATKDAQASCGQTWSATHTNTIKGIEIEKFDIPVSVQLDVYSGEASGHDDDIACNSGDIIKLSRDVFTSGYNVIRGKEISAGRIEFLPYIQMNYDTYVEKYKTAYVLGEHKRSLELHSFAEFAWKQESDSKLTLSSLQWSTHKSAVDKWGAGNTLPGGAALSLGIKKDDRQTFLVSTYQPVIIGKGKEQIEKTGGSYDSSLTIDLAKNEHDMYINSVRDAIDKLGIEQWVNKNTGANEAWSSGGKAVHEEDDISFLGTSGLHASDEDKYYFRQDGEQGGISAGEGDLDAEILGTTQKVYTFFTNTKGEIRMVEGETAAETINVGSEDLGVIADLSNPTVQAINNRTHVYDKLAKVLERGTGQDKAYGIDGLRSKSGVQWYNEGYDGISILVEQSSIVVGYAKPPERTSVLDPRLCPKNENGQSGMFKEYIMSQYKTKPYSEAYAGTNNKVGVFKGVDIYTDNMDKFFWSKKFYIANVNTQDLH